MSYLNSNVKTGFLFPRFYEIHKSAYADTIKGSGLYGVISARDIINSISLIRLYQSSMGQNLLKGRNVIAVTLTGIGDVALNAAIIAARLGGSVTLVCRSGRNDFTAGDAAVNNAEVEGVRFMFYTNPLEVKNDGNGRAAGLYCEEMAAYTSGDTGETKLVPLYDSEFEIKADIVILADC